MNNSPFIDIEYNRLTCYEWFKMIVLGPVAILRFVYSVILFTISYYFIKFESATNIDVLNVIKIMLKLYLVGIGFNIRIKGKKYLEEGLKNNAVIVYNHISFIDQFVMMSATFSSFISSSYFEKIPIISGCNKFLESLYIYSKESATAKLVERIQCKTKRFPMSVAPEGALSNGKALLKFRSGAFVAKAPVLPIIMRYPHKYFNPAWTIDNPLFICYRMLSQFYNNAIVEFLPIVYPHKEETPVEFAQRVRKIMADALDVPMVDLDVHDKIEFMRKYRYNFMRSAIVAR